MKFLDNNKMHEIKTSYNFFNLLNYSPPPPERYAPAISNKKGISSSSDYSWNRLQ